MTSGAEVTIVPSCRIQLRGQRLTGLLLQPQLETGQRPDLPPLQAIDLHTEFTRNRVERLATQAAATPHPVSGSRSTVVPAPRAPDPIAAASAPTPVALRAPSVGADPAPFTPLDRTIPPPPGDIGFSLNPCPRKLGAPHDWMRSTHPDVPFERYADDIVAHCRTETQAQQVLAHIKRRLAQCRLEVHPEKTRIVYCKDDDRPGQYPTEQFTFPGIHVSLSSGQRIDGVSTSSASYRR